MSAAASKPYISPEEERALVERMTTAILETMRAKKICEPGDLIAKGFMPDEVSRNWVLAKASADFELRISKR